MISILKMEKKYVKLSKNGYINMVLVLLSIHIVNGAVVYSTSGSTYFGDSLVVTFTISPSFTTSATVSQDSILRSSCIPTVCGPNLHNNITFTPSSTKITLTFNPVLSSQKGDWQCLVDTGELAIFPFNPTSAPSNNPCKGVEKTTIVLCITHGAPVVLEVIIVIIIIIIDTQKVKIIVTGKKQDKQLQSAKQKINKGVEKTVNIKDNKCSIDVRGGDFHACVFQNDAGVVELDFMITDDLLNVKPGSAITLPTVLLVKPDIFNKQWSHDGNIIQNNALLFHTIVTKSTYGVYDLDIMFDNLGLTILIKNMRVQARNWIIIMICVVVNVPLALIGGGVTAYYRSTDGFCVNFSVTIIAFALIIVYIILAMVFIYLFFLKKTGNEKNSGCGLPLGSCCQSSIKPNATESGQPNVVMITTENVWINTPIGRKMPDLPAIQLTNQTATGMEDKKQKKKKKKSKNQIKDSSRNDIHQSQEDTVQAIAD